MNKILSRLLLLIFSVAINAKVFAQTYTTSGTFTPPAGVTSVIVECWGGGGAGGAATGNPAAGGGGAGGSYVKNTSIAVSQGTTYTVTVGAGGVGGSGVGGNGGDSWFGSISTILAKGGLGGALASNNNSTASGAAALTSGNVGATSPFSYYGGAGGTGGASGASGGGGGSSAGTVANGNAASGLNAGAAVAGGGAGVSGSTGSADGANNTNLGGGGAGGRAGGNTDRLGGNGGAGQVIVSWTCPTYSLTSTTVSSVCAGSASTVTLNGNLPVGSYVVTYNLSSPNSGTSLTANMTVTSANSGNFTTSNLTTSGSTTITITSIKSGSGTSVCTSAINSNNTGTISVTAISNVSVSISSSDVDNSICIGNSVTFTATPTNGGISPSYQWKLNGVNVGTNSSTYTTTTLANNDVVAVELTTSLACYSNSPATSNAITTRVSTPNAVATASINSSCGTSTISLSGTINADTSRAVLAFQGFESAGSTVTYATSNSATNAVGTKTVSTGGSDAPSNAPYYFTGTTGYWLNNGTSTITTANITGLGSYIDKQVSFKLQSISLGNNNNGADAGDNVTVAISLNGGTSYSNELVVTGNSNAYWSYTSGTATASTTYTGANPSVSFGPSGGGSRTTDGYSTIQISLPDTCTQVRIKITLLNNSNNEVWAIDDIALSKSNTTVSWTSNPSGFTSSLLNPGNVTVTSSTVYTMAATNGAGCTSSDTAGVIINTIPANPIVIGGSNCGTGTVNLSATPGTNQVIDWYSASSGGSLLASASNTYTTPSISATTVYFAQARNLSTGCVSARIADTAKINALPSAPTSPVNASRCGTGTVNISATIGSGGNSIYWYAASSGGSSLGTGASFTTPSISSTTTYYAESVNTITGCVSATRTAVTATIAIQPTASAGGSQTICGAQAVTVSGASSSNGTILWTENGAGSITSGSTSLTPVYTAIAGDNGNTITLTMTVSNAPCVAATATYSILVSTLPTAPTAVNNAVCQSGTVNLSVTPSQPAGFTYSWYGVSSGGTALTTGTSYSTPVISTTTVYYVESRNNTTGCISTRTPVTATVNPNLPASVSISSNATNNTICAGTSIIFTATPVNGGANPSYQWKVNGANAGTNSATFTTSALTNGQTVQVVMTSNATPCLTGSPANSNTITPTVNPLPAAPGAINASRCGTGTLVLGATTTGANKIDWYNAATAGTLQLSNSTNFVTPSISTTSIYYAQSRDSVTGCVSSTRTSVTATVNPVTAVTCPGNIATCNNNIINITGLSPAGGTLTGVGISGTTFNPVVAGIGVQNINYSYTTTQGCTSSCSFQIQVSSTAPVVTAAPSYYVYSGTSTNINLNSTVVGTTYTWTVTSNSPDVIGYSSQSTPVAGPINQVLYNNGSSTADLTYTITPSLNGNCIGTPIYVVVTIPNSTFCDDPGSFFPGSCIINMGVTPQTIGNGLKPYGLVYELVNTYNIPVYWCIRPDKTYQSAVTKVDQEDFNLNGVSYKGGAFVIPSNFVSQVQNVINNWVAQGVVVNYSNTVFSPPVYDLITRMPKVVLDANTGSILESGFYTKAGIPNSAYSLGGVPTNITGCDDIYALPHADPDLWSQLYKDSLLNFINTRGWLFSSCKAVSGIESVPTMRFLSDSGLVIDTDHNDGTIPYNYSLKQGNEGNQIASDPFMQFVGTLDGAIDYGLETIYLPVKGWRSTTKVAVYDSNFVNTFPNPDVAYPNKAGVVVYGRAFGDTSKGMVLYVGGHDFEHGTESEDVAAARTYGNFILRAGVGTRPKIVPVSIPSSAFSGQTIPLSVFLPSTQSAIVSYQWFSDFGAVFSTQSTSTNMTVPGVDVTTVGNLQFKVKDACGRIGLYCTSIIIYPTIVNNHIATSQTVCAGTRPDTLRGTTPRTNALNPLSFRWLISSTSSSTGFNAAPGINNQSNYYPPPLAAGLYWFRREVTSDTITVVSSSIQITVKPSPSVTALATIGGVGYSTASICQGQSLSLSSIGLNSSDTLGSLSLSNTQDLTIRDNYASGIADSITVVGAPATMAQLLSISVTVNVTHPRDQDLELYLIRPGGRLNVVTNGTYTNSIFAGESIALVADRGASNADFTNTTFTDTAATAVAAGAAPFTGFYKPENAFSTLTGNPNGDWTLKAVDDNNTNNTGGILRDWTIKMKFLNGVTYSWSSTPASFTSTLQNPGVVTPASTITYVVNVSEVGNTCKGKDSLPITVSPLSVAGTASAPSIICAGTSTDSVRLSGYTGAIQWQSSTNGTTFTNIVGATSATYSLGLIASNTYFRAVVTSGNCSSSTSNTVFVTITIAPTPANAGPDQLTVCGLSTSLAANAPAIGTGVWSIISGVGGVIANVNSPTSSFTGQANITYTLRWTTSNNPCQISTDDVVIAFNTSIVITTQPVSPVSLICVNSTASFTIVANGSGTLNYQWYLNSVNSNTGGTLIADATFSSFTPVITSTTPSYFYCVVSNQCGLVNSNTVVVTAAAEGTWLGVNRNWDDPANWCDGIPDEDDSIIIPSGLTNYPLINVSDAVVKNIKINGGRLDLDVSGYLSLFGTINNISGVINARNGTIEYSGDTTQSIDGNVFAGNLIGNLIINNADVKLISPLNILNKLSFKGNDRILTTNDFLTLKSSDTLTASVADLTTNGTSSGIQILGKVSVERFASSRRAWRLLSMPTMHDYQTIKQSWQEGSTVPNSNPVSRYGIQITSNRSSWFADGFDTLSPAGPSLKVYNPVTNLYDGILNTNNSYFEIGKAYMTFIRGDRSITQISQAPTVTTLREKGTLFTGNLTVGIGTATGQFVSVGNPYASAIDFAKTSRNNLENSYYLWDPKLSTYGAYQTCLVSGNMVFNTPGGGSYANGNFNIQSGQGFFVRTINGPGEITFKENCKADGSAMVNRGPLNLSMLRTNLYQIQSGRPVLYDGVLNLYDTSFSNAIDQLDALKLGNFNENISIKNGDKSLAIETRKGIEINDTIKLKLGQVKITSYKFEFIPQSLAPFNVQPYLEDLYLNTQTAISISDTTRIDFSIINVPGSYASDRFRVIFKTLRPLPVDIVSLKANRLSEKVINVDWKSDNELSLANYQVERSRDAVNFIEVGSLTPKLNNGGSASYHFSDFYASPDGYFYRIKSTSLNGQIQISNIVKVNAVDQNKKIYISPNPVENKELRLVFENQLSGEYTVSLFTKDGKLVKRFVVNINQANASKTIKLKKSVSSGSYTVLVVSDNGLAEPINIIVQ